VNVGSIRALRVNAVQENGRTARVVTTIVAWPLWTSHSVIHIADNDDLILIRLEGRQYWREFQCPFFSGGPVRHHRTVRHEAQSHAYLWIGSRFRKRRLGGQHRFQKRQGQTHSHSADKCSARKVLPGNERHFASFI